MARGHKVIMLTNMFMGERSGLRNYPSGFKHYYLPAKPMILNSLSLMAWWHMYFVIREIIIKE